MRSPACSSWPAPTGGRASRSRNGPSPWRACRRRRSEPAVSADFSAEQKRYLEGLVAGLSALRPEANAPAANGEAPPTGPDATHLKSMARFEAQGKKLSDPETWKREEHPFDAYRRLKEQATANSPPKPPDNFRWRFHGLFYVAPTQDS